MNESRDPNRIAELSPERWSALLALARAGGWLYRHELSHEVFAWLLTEGYISGRAGQMVQLTPLGHRTLTGAQALTHPIALGSPAGPSATGWPARTLLPWLLVELADEARRLLLLDALAGMLGVDLRSDHLER